MLSPRLSSAGCSSLLRALLLAAPLLAACGGGGGGDAPSEPLADAYGDGLRVAELIGPADWVDPENDVSEGCVTPADRDARVTGVGIVAIDDFDETGDGARGNFYVQDASGDPAPYSGVTVYAPSFSPPDLRLAPGDVADLLGVYTEFVGPASSKFPYCRTLPEIGGTMSFRFDNNRPIAPKTITPIDLKTYDEARKYLGMLVRVEGVTLTSNGSGSGGRYTASMDVGGGIEEGDVPKISNELYDIKGEGPELKDEMTFKSVTGVVTYFYGFKIAPRSPADFEL